MITMFLFRYLQVIYYRSVFKHRSKVHLKNVPRSVPYFLQIYIFVGLFKFMYIMYKISKWQLECKYIAVYRTALLKQLNLVYSFLRKLLYGLEYKWETQQHYNGCLVEDVVVTCQCYGNFDRDQWHDRMNAIMKLLHSKSYSKSGSFF